MEDQTIKKKVKFKQNFKLIKNIAAMNYKRLFTKTLFASTLFLLSACASIVSKSSYPISINSTPSEAKITVKNKKGMSVFKGNTPANFELEASNGFFSKASYNVTFEKEGYESKTVPIHFSLDGWYIGNIGFGGLIGWLIVDPATGAMWKLDTEYINESLSKTIANKNKPSLKILNYNDVPDKVQNNLVRIKK